VVTDCEPTGPWLVAEEELESYPNRRPGLPYLLAGATAGSACLQPLLGWHVAICHTAHDDQGGCPASAADDERGIRPVGSAIRWGLLPSVQTPRWPEPWRAGLRGAKGDQLHPRVQPGPVGVLPYSHDHPLSPEASSTPASGR
jgi:hypothetical protein